MKKEEVSQLLKETANLLELSGENPFKVKAYFDASRAVLGVDDLNKLILEDKLKEIKGIGKSISDFIKILDQSGTHPLLEELRGKFSKDLLELLKIPGLGPKKILILNKELNITSIQDLKYAIYENRLINISGFGKRTQDKLNENLKFYESIRGKLLLNEAIDLENEILLKYKNIHPAGLLRRRMPVVDFLEFVLKDLNFQRFVEEISEENLKFEKDLISFNFRGSKVVIYSKGKNFFKTLFEKTGSIKHIEDLKKIGKIPEDINSEEEIYERLNLNFIPPEMREGIGELEISKNKFLSKILDFKDIKGTLHNHTFESDGSSSIEDFVNVSKKMNLNFLGIADHSKSAKYAGGLEPDELLKQAKKIKEISKEKNFLIFSGVESDILLNGKLDYEDEILKELDYVVGSIHSHFNLKKEEQTERILKAISNKYFKILGHPTGRILLGRKGYEIDLEIILEKLSEEKKWIELNSNPLRLDLDWSFIKIAQDLKIPISINPDAHNSDDLKDIYYGVLMARKGLLFKENCVNAWDNEKILKELKKL